MLTGKRDFGVGFAAAQTALSSCPLSRGQLSRFFQVGTIVTFEYSD